MGKENTRAESPVVDGNFNPIWNFEVELASWEPGHSLLFTVRDKNPETKLDDLLGTAVLDSEQFFPYGFDGNVRLEGAGRSVEAALCITIAIEEDDREYLKFLISRSQEGWEELLKKGGGNAERTRSLGIKRPGRFQGKHVADIVSKHVDDVSGSCFIRHPLSKKQITWDLLSFVIIAYDSFMIPYTAAFDPDMSEALLTATCLVTAFWMLDILSSFTVGQYHGEYDADVNMLPWAIAKRYLQRRFLLDFMLVLVDVIFIVLTVTSLRQSAETALGERAPHAVRAVRAARTIRILTMVRMSKLQPLYDHWSDGKRSQHILTMVQILAPLTLLLTANHIICCLWFALGTWHGQGITWVSAKEEMGTMGTEYQYFTSYHWAITQFTPASMEIFPRNAHERAFALVIDLLGLVAFSTFVSSITTRMSAIRQHKEQRLKNQETLRRFFRQNHSISPEVMKSVSNFMKRKSVHHKRVHTEEMKFLSDLPGDLKESLFCEVYLPLMAHPFVRCLALLDNHSILHLCSAAIVDMTAAATQDLFTIGQPLTTMWFVVSGTLTYTRLGHTRELQKQAWVCEAVLWIDDWIARGVLTATKSSELIGIRADVFRKVVAGMELASEARRYTLEYAKCFIRACEDMDLRLLFNDVWCKRSASVKMCNDALRHARIEGKDLKDLGMTAEPVSRLFQYLPSLSSRN